MTGTKLSPLSLPAVDGDWSTWLADRTGTALQRAGELRTEVVASPPDAVLGVWNQLNTQLANCFAVASLISQVHPHQAVREQAEKVEIDANRFQTELMLDSDVYAALAATATDGLDDAARRVLEHTLRDFRRAGVDRDDATRARLREINERELELGQAFSRGIRDGKATTTLPASALDGMPQDWVDEHPVDENGEFRLTTEYPDTVPFMTFATDSEARRKVLHTQYNVGWPGNDEVLGELLALRHEHATILGYPDWPTYDAEVKMIGTGDAIPAFIDGIAEDTREAGERDLAVLLERARQDDPSVEAIDTTNWRHYAEVVRREQLDVDAQEVRRYFDFTKVRQGLLDVTGRLFGLEYTEVADASSWHGDVTSYDVSLGGAPLGRIHLDLHPREGKYNHAAQFDLVPGLAGVQLPEGVLVCNFPRGLMEHGDVVTLFHEFGHLVHHVLAGRHDWIRFSGVATEWDFVEAPSQMLEEWAWDADVLAGFATDEDGTPIPPELVDRMLAGEEFGKGFLARTQMFYAAVSYWLHRDRPDDITARVTELAERYSQIRTVPDTHFHTGFGHLEGYTSGYYTYMWSLVIAKDLFSAFDADDLFESSVAHRYRDRILAAGGSGDAADLVADFLGRPYDSRAFKAWMDAAPEAAG